MHPSLPTLLLAALLSVLTACSGEKTAPVETFQSSDATDIGKTIHAHPTLGESIGMAAEVAHGSCTDLPPQRKK